MTTRPPVSSLSARVLLLCTPLVCCALAAASAQPAEIRAVHRSGQTFVTWREDSSSSGESYHVYRHTAPITAATLSQAQQLTATWGPLPEGSGHYLTERDREAASGAYPGLDNYVIEDLGAELADGTGLFVWTTEESDSFYYAVTTVSGGAENRSNFSAGNALPSPMVESVADPEPVLVWQNAAGTSRVYTQFMDFAEANPTFERPEQGLQYAYNYWVSLPTADMCGGSVPDPLPLYLQIEGFGSRYQVADASMWGWCVVGIWGDDPRQSWYFGYSATHDYRSDTAPSSGPIVNYTEERLLRSIYDTMRSPLYNVDPERVYVYGHSMGGSGALALGMRYPTVFAATYSSEPMTDYSSSGDGGGVDWREDTVPKWGSLSANLPIENRGRFAAPLATYDGTGVWDWQNHQLQLVDRRADEMAYIGLAHGARDEVIEWATQGQPAYEPFYLGRHAFSGECIDLDHCWANFAGQGPMVEDWRYSGPFHSFGVRRDESMPALSYASGSSSVPPSGAGAHYNMNLEWSSSWSAWNGPPLDTPESWELSLRTTDGSTQTVNVTPRRLQAFVVDPSQSYTWQNLRVADGVLSASDVVTAAADGLLTVPAFQVTPSGNTLVITPLGGGANRPPTASFEAAVSGLSVSFTDRSSDADGSLVSWAWSFGDGTESELQNPSHGYSAAGSYEVRLTVTDDGGASASTTQTVQLSDGGDSSTAFRRGWPLSRRGVAVFNDQLAPRMSEAQLAFCARRYAGTQKMTRDEADRLRELNPDFLILHYRLGHGLGYRAIEGDCEPTGEYIPIIEGNDWVQEWPGDAQVQERWFSHWPESSGTRVLNCDWGWYLMEVDEGSWREYWHDEVLRQVQANDADGVFMDSLSVPNYLGADHYDPVFPWVDEDLESAWSERIEQWLEWLQGQELGGYALIPNVGQWITSREQTSYLPADGVMVEGFALEGSAEPYPLGDWRLQMNRVLEMAVAGKALLLQSYAVWQEEARMFVLGSYLLTKGDRSYLNLEIDYEPEWWPEYDIPLGAPSTALPSHVDELWDSANQVYRREFDNGLVLVNPDPEAAVTVTLDDAYVLVSCTGGGSLPANGVPTGSLSSSFVTQVRLEAASAAVLLDQEPSCGSPPAAPSSLRGAAAADGISLSWSPGAGPVADHFNIYRSSGGCPHDGTTPVLVGETPASTEDFVDHSSLPCTTYWYTVRAADAGNFCESSPSSCVGVHYGTECDAGRMRRTLGPIGGTP